MIGRRFAAWGLSQHLSRLTQLYIESNKFLQKKGEDDSIRLSKASILVDGSDAFRAPTDRSRIRWRILLRRCRLDAKPKCRGRGFGSVSDVELSKYVRQVIVHGLLADKKILGDLLVGFA